jgi:hypothetical protein
MTQIYFCTNCTKDGLGLEIKDWLSDCLWEGV